MTSTSSGLTMLTSGVSQYLHPDYLQPLPTTLDAKKSPLALLAQTCSAIGKDTSPSKPIIPPLEKSDKNADCDNNSSGIPKRPSSHGSNKDSSTTSNNKETTKPGFRTFPPKEVPALVPISSQPSPEKHSTSSSVSLPLEAKSRSPLGTDPVLLGSNNSITTASSSTSSSSLLSSSSSSSSSRPVSRGLGGSSCPSGNQRSSSRSSNSGKSEPDSHHHQHQQIHHQQLHSSHHHHHQHQQQQQHHHHQQQHTPNHHRSRDSPSASSSSSSSSTSSSSHIIKSSSSPSHSKPSSSTPSSTSVMQSLSSLSTMKPSPISTNPALLSGLSPAHLAGYPHPLSLMGHGLDPSNPAYHSALAAHSSLSSLSAAAVAAQSSALKAAAAASSAAPPPGAALSPYVTYARVRTPSGATALVPVCRDPYCTNCQLTLQNCHVSATCTAPGCAQCAHEKSLTSLSALGSLGAASSLLLPPLTSSSASSAALSSNLSALSSLHSLYPPGALAAAAHPGLPYTCNWVAGNDYCGKRFNSSEELLQHLRSHTSSMDSSSFTAASYASLGAGLPSAAALAAAYQHFPAGASAPLSPNSLRRAYPTSLSPVSNLLGASRYHPYKSPLSGVPPGAAPPPQAAGGYPPVGPFFSPYTFFGQRLGAAVVP